MAKRKAANKPVASKLPSGYKQRAGSFPASWYPEPGDTLEGTVTEYRSIETKFGESDVFTVREKTTGLDWSVFVSGGLVGRVKKSDRGKKVFLQRVADIPSKKKGRNAMKAFVVGIAG